METIYFKLHLKEIASVFIGNHSHSGDAKLEAETVTLIGNHRFENLEINSDETTVIGNIDSDGTFIINTDTVNVSDGKEIAEDFARQVSENREEAAAEPEQATETQPFDQVQADEAYINWDYVEAAAAERQISPEEYLRSLVELPEMEGFYNREIIGGIKQYQNAEWEKVFGNPAVSEEPISVSPE